MLPAARDAFRLSDPFFVRYVRWFGGGLTGNFGYGIASGVSIAHILGRRLRASPKLSVSALLNSKILGTLLGLASELREGWATDNLLTVVGMPVGFRLPMLVGGTVVIEHYSNGLVWEARSSQPWKARVTRWFGLTIDTDADGGGND